MADVFFPVGDLFVGDFSDGVDEGFEAIAFEEGDFLCEFDLVVLGEVLCLFEGDFSFVGQVDFISDKADLGEVVFVVVNFLDPFWKTLETVEGGDVVEEEDEVGPSEDVLGEGGEGAVVGGVPEV